MLLYLAIFVYFVGLHVLLIFLFTWGKHWKVLYQAVLLDVYALERVRRFFQTLRPILEVLYRFVDHLKKNTGRPPTDYRFQLRFLLWWKFFEPGPITTAVRKFNHSPELRQLLEAPAKPYTRFALKRFLDKLQGRTVPQMCLWLLTKLLTTGRMDSSQLIVDSFPIYSFLNFSKCLRTPKFNKTWAQRFFDELSLEQAAQLFPKAHSLAAPDIDKLKCWIYHHLWDVPSKRQVHQRIFGKKQHQALMGLKKGWKTGVTYQNFLKRLKELPNAQEIEQAVLAEVQRVLQVLQTPALKHPLKTIQDLRRVLHTPHHLKDKEISLSTCSTKHQTFMGRGGLILVTHPLTIPLLLQVTPTYKQNKQSILKFFNTLHQMFGPKLKHITVFGDSEFGIQTVQETLAKYFHGKPRTKMYGTAKKQDTHTTDEKRIRIGVERGIARINTNFQLEQPRCLGTAAVELHTQLCWLCDLLLLKYNLLRGNKKHPHSMIEIRG